MQTSEGEIRRPLRKIRVLIVEDHPLFRDGLRMAIELEDDINVVAVSGDGEEAVQLAVQHHPDIVLLDVNLPLMNGLQVMRRMKATDAHIAVIVLTAYHDEEQVLHAIRNGAAAYCPKDISAEDLIEIIRDAAEGYYIVDEMRLDKPGLQSWIQIKIQAFTGPYALSPEEHFVPLSPREMEILQFVTHGLSNKEIASELNISQQTVKNHMTSILKKLNVQDRTQAAVTALRRGWVRLQDRKDSNAPNRL